MEKSDDKPKSLLALTKQMAIDWINGVDNVEELIYSLPTKAFEPSASKGPDTKKLRESVAQGSGTPVVDVVTEPVVSAKPTKKKAGGQVRKTAGEFTDAKREVIREKVGDLDLTSKMYAKVREGLCRELGLNRRQVTMYMSGIRKVKSGTSSISLARAAKTKKVSRRGRKATKKK